MKTTQEKSEGESKILHFWTTGENMTTLVRDMWVSDEPKKALETCRLSFGMSDEQALLLITGKKKLEGSTREGDGTLGMVDDDTTEVSGIKLDLQVMVLRIERKYKDILESLNLFKDYIGRINDEDEIEYYTNAIKYKEEELIQVSGNLEAVYGLAGRSNAAEITKLSIKARSAKEIKAETARENEARAKELKRTEPFTTFNGSGTFYIVHCPVEKCKEQRLNAGWLLPDGTFFGGDSMWIHRGIIETLKEYDFFKDTPNNSEVDDLSGADGWIKFTGGTWYIWENAKKLTNEQIEFVLKYTVECSERENINLQSNYNVHIKIFAELLNGAEFNAYEMAKRSKELFAASKEKELSGFPTVEEVAAIDILSTPFFQPNVAFVKWLIKYADGRIMIDCGAGSGYLTAMITHLGGKCIAVEPDYTLERNLFWKKRSIVFHLFGEKSEVTSIIKDCGEKALLLFARPCHSNFVYDTITKNMPKGVEALYISHESNNKIDLRDIPYTEIKHEGKSKDNEYVLSIRLNDKKEKDFVDWLTEDGLPKTKAILAELKKNNANRDAAKVWLKANNVEITEGSIQEWIDNLGS